MTHPTQTWFVILKEASVLIHKNHLLNQIDMLPLKPYFLRQLTLGSIHESMYYCAEIKEDIPLNHEFHFIPLRQALSMLPSEHCAMTIKACSIINWDKNHQFCGRCATETTHRTPHFVRFCPACDSSFYPRISPAIIILVHRGKELVMARSPHFASGVYGLIAGFVEAGESLEDAAQREIKEEVGLQVKNIRYFGSQPWPFPDLLMIAFTAEYHSGELVIDNQEIEHAGWYPYNNLPGRPSSPQSIATKLLDHFIHSCQ